MNIKELKGVGPKTLKILEQLNVFSVSDILEYYPFRYQIFNMETLDTVSSLIDVCVSGIIETEAKVFYIKKNLNRLSFRVNSNNRIVNVTIFNRAFLKNNLYVGREIVLYGKYDARKNSFIASDIKFEVFQNQLIEPVYHLVAGISNKDLRRLINNALLLDTKIEDYIPSEVNNKYEFVPKDFAILNIHQPKDLIVLKKAKLKLIYEELFIFLLKIACLKNYQSKALGIERDLVWESVSSFLDCLPFELTVDQMKSVRDIFKDLNDRKKMNRLLLGDVGSGKTIVSVVAMYLNFLSGYQSALMAPTEILATQHYFSIKNLLNKFDISVEILVGSQSKKEKNNIIERLKCGEIDVLIGTHAIISGNVVFKNLGLVVTDEQHRFGVNQRNNLQSKGMFPDVLYMSATPIPRTYALTLYGDMDTSIIATKPLGRKDIKTYVKKESEIKEVLRFCLEEIKLGHQIYVVAPVIEESEMDLHDVNNLKEKFQMAFNNKINVVVLHGKIKSSEKDAIMNDFKLNKINILISTTVIEVGIDVKNASTMIIFDADRFGLSTLHQLRGRVGRGEVDSYCFLICDKDVPRLKVLEESNDGFYIAEKDFELRGEGDLFGTMQSGDMVFKIANIKRDFKILLQAKNDVDEFMNTEEVNDQKYQKIIESLNFVD